MSSLGVPSLQWPNTLSLSLPPSLLLKSYDSNIDDHISLFFSCFLPQQILAHWITYYIWKILIVCTEPHQTFLIPTSSQSPFLNLSGFPTVTIGFISVIFEVH